MASPHPQVQALLDGLAAAGMPAFADLTPVGARQLMAEMAKGQPPLPSPPIGPVTDITIPGPGGSLRVRHYAPKETPRATMVYLHGGGWVLGDPDASDVLCRRLVAGAGCDIYSVDYRLAPEHPFPAGLDDAVAALTWAAGKSKLPLFVGGDSAGGNLSAACALRIRDAGGPKLAGQVLIYPVTDHDFKRPSYLQNGEGGLLLTTRDMHWFWGHYVANVAQRSDPLASPLRAKSLKGLPPALVIVAELDPLCDEGVAYAERLKTEGTPTELWRYNDMIHGFLGFIGLVDTAGEVADAAAQWIKARA